MKKINYDSFFGCCVISIGIMVAGWMIGEQLPDTTQVPSSLYLSTDNDDKNYDNYLTIYETAEYLKIYEEDVNKMIETGALDGTYFIVGEEYVFSREKLDEWVDGLLK